MKKLIDKFVCVRIVKANDLDLTLFQFDYDLTFAVVFMNADKTIYGRYGTRSNLKDAAKDMTLAGLAKSMSAALILHKRYPANKKYLEGKQPIATKYKIPDDLPSLRGKFKKTLDYKGDVTKSCMHCHQVRDAERQTYRDAGQPIPDRLLFPNPSASVIGLTLDPRERAKVTKVARNSPAANSGFKPGDQILTFADQAILSAADMQWVLHNTKSSDELDAAVKRGGEIVRLKLKLEESWRRRSDIAWRESSWPLRRMGTGGMSFAEATKDQRRSVGVSDDALALVVKRAAHPVAKGAGFKKGDLVVSFDGKTKNMSASQLLAYAAQNTKPGQQIRIIVSRKGKRLELKLRMQK